MAPNNNCTNGIVQEVKVIRNKPKKMEPVKYINGVVKKVLSGEAVIIQELEAEDGPSLERQINFSNVVAPNLARRATNSQPETQDEPCAWMAREFLRKKLIGKKILFTVETKTQSGRVYGTVFLGDDVSNLMNVTEMMISEGLLTVRQKNIRSESKLPRLEDAAKASGKGIWAPDAYTYVRDVKWSVDDLKALVDKEDGKPVKAIIEHVKDGSTVRLLLLPDYHHVTLMISGIMTLKVKSEEQNKKANAESYAEEAKFFIESRLLHRDVEVHLEGYDYSYLIGSIIHPHCNIAEILLKEGYAKCADWSIGAVTGGAEKLRSAEKFAKRKKLGMWTGYEPPTTRSHVKRRKFIGKVTEVGNWDDLFIKKSNGDVKKVFLGIKLPKLSDIVTNRSQQRARKNIHPLYDSPWRYEAREFLRKKLIGQMVHVTVDYVLPPYNNLPEKICCSVRIGDVNISHEIVSKGLAFVLRRNHDEQRPHNYDDLLSAEVKAFKDKKGVHSMKDLPIHRVLDITRTTSKAPNMLSVLKGVGKTEAIVEHFMSGSRMRLYIPKENCLVIFLLEGITCPKVQRPTPGGVSPGEPFGAEALEFMNELLLQREVQIEVSTIDKGGNFIGWLHFENQNMSVQLVENGLSTIHRKAEGTIYSQELYTAERMAKEKKLNIWANFSEFKIEERPEEFQTERIIDYKSMIIREVTIKGQIFGQYCSDGPALETLMDNLSKEFEARPPVAGAYSPREGDLCAAKFVDGNWYRAKVVRVSGDEVDIFYIDYGNWENTDSSKLAPLALQFTSQPGSAHAFSLALTKFPKDDDSIDQVISYLLSEYEGKVVKVNHEYRVNGTNFCTVQRVGDESDVAKTLLSLGMLLVRQSKDKRFQGLLSEYNAVQEEAKRNHLNIWQRRRHR